MSKTEDEILDPIVAAALFDDPTDDDEEKELTAKALKEAEEAEGNADEDKDDDDEELEEKKVEDDKELEEEKSEEPENKPAEKSEEPHKSRRERREERKLSFVKDNPKLTEERKQLFQADPNYKPLDYEAQEEFKSDVLASDRENYGKNEFAKGAAIGEELAEQEHFWEKTSLEAKLLTADPAFNFLAEELPDGTENPDFDEDMASEVNELYLAKAGFKEIKLYDDAGRPIFDPNTGLHMKRAIVTNTKVSYEETARNYVKNLNKLAERKAEESRANLESQRKRQGIRPSGGSHKAMGPLQPGSFAKMTDEEFEKYDKESDDYILSAF